MPGALTLVGGLLFPHPIPKARDACESRQSPIKQHTIPQHKEGSVSSTQLLQLGTGDRFAPLGHIIT